jgi:iduronate 2-sulfatase
MGKRTGGRPGVWVALGLALLAGCGPGRRPGPRGPNVLLIIADDLSFRVGLYGFAARTPNLDRLAARGRRFDRAYCQYPLCNPSRTSFLSGWRPERTQVWGNLRAPRAHIPGAVPLQERFEANGYFTARVGKVYHSRFEEEFHWDQVRDTYDEVSEDTKTGPEWGPSGRRDEEEPDGLAARRTVELLHEKRDRPFFIGVGFLKPHAPWIVPDAYFRMYPPASVELPPESPSDRQIVVERRGSLDDAAAMARPREARAAYFASVTFMDAQLGLILDALDEQRLWDRTVVLMTSDNGLHVGEHGLWGKMTLFEESARVPLVIAGAGVKRPGEATSSLVELVDLYPTLLELGRLTKVEGLDGTSLVPLLLDPDRAVKTAAFTSRKVGATRKVQMAESVRTARYRYTEWPEGGIELYDHERDPDERHDLSGEPAQAGTIKELKRLLDEHRRQVPLPPVAPPE